MNNKRKNIAVLMGGPSAEHEVSLNTGKMVMAGLRDAGYRAMPVTITREGEWIFPKAKHLTLGRALDKLKAAKTDIAFIAMHGPFGEDGTIQGLLEYAGIPYTGSGVLASALAMDKAKSYELFAAHGLRVPKYLVVRGEKWEVGSGNVLREIERKSGFPCVVKPVNLGSSVGVSIVKEEKDLKKALAAAFQHGVHVLVDEYIKGTEVTCGVLDDGGGSEPIALPVTEIIPVRSAFFDYKAKYTKGECQEITPARIPSELTKRVQAVALAAHRILGCSGMSRADMIIERPAFAPSSGASAGRRTTNDRRLTTVDKEGGIYLLEVNTIPGMTETSLLPQAARAAGIPFPKLLDRIIRAALKK